MSRSKRPHGLVCLLVPAVCWSLKTRAVRVLGAQVAVLTLERERANAWISLYRAAGGGWDASQTQALLQVSENK